MSLKSFHLVFVTAAIVLAFGFGAWMLRAYRSPEGMTGDLVWAIACFVCGVGLIAYEGYFLKKLKNESFL